MFRFVLPKPGLRLTILLLLTYSASAPGFGQATQTIRGKVYDAISNAALPGATVVVLAGETTQLGSSTDENGQFRIANVPVGRQTLRVSFIGYEEQTIPNVVVTAGKEVVLNITLTEGVNQLNEVVVISNTKDDKTATNNDMTIVSARSFNVDDTKRYAGALGDPSRMAANFAGVVGGNDSRNDIVVRGNSPTGMLWQLEGLNIPNPNHFGALVSTGGPVSILNNNNLGKSDFMTSAFPAQYGNAIAGVFDIRLREGNDEQREFVGQVGFNGFELGAEGPFSSKGNKGSYIINYRYSTLGIFSALGIEFGTGNNVPLYQDLNMKVVLPTKGGGKWTVFGVGGLSNVDLLGSEADLQSNTNLYGNENSDAYANYATGVAGLSYEKNIRNTYFRITGGVSATAERFDSDSLVRNGDNEVIGRYLRARGDLRTQKYSLAGVHRVKLNARNSIVSGAYIDATRFDLFNQDVYANLNTDTVRLNVADNATLYQAYSSWKHRFNPHWQFNAGVHAQYYSLPDQWALEPRAGLLYMINARHSLGIGYGLHNQAQNITTSFAQTRTAAGDILQTNRSLGFTSSQHVVLTYDWNITENTRVKVEGYYQRLDRVPVESKPSSYAALNSGMSFAPDDQDSLTNNGSGRNYGVELTLERFFSKGFYYLITGSFFDSKYTGSDGVERNTAFNTNYVVNALVGKEWQLGQGKNFVSVNLRLTAIGGKRLTPIDFARSQEMGQTVYIDDRAFSEQQDPYFRADLRFSYRKEYKRSTLEVSVDLQNVTNRENIFMQSYNPRTNTIVTQYQQSFFPVPYCRFTF